ncbi:Hypothetical predicted protein [Mytilus galloprovincialis]|uniref:Uncharacterized protein n=1 Tax=Mytilus galloprovincialis TaxID=29158 RepID=A0A8B6EAD5_MYTGA|nr:Hypothetical predicted protein [Mytilus galloprovincialis]
MSDAWDADDFEPEVPVKTTDQWEGEDEDDVKDNWEDDDDEEKKTEEKDQGMLICPINKNTHCNQFELHYGHLKKRDNAYL